jgi:hypothetical protein
MADARHYPTLFTFRSRIARSWLLLPILLCLLAIVACILYLSHSYGALRDWYLGLFPCIYKAWEWPEKFFTPMVKQAGNYYCIAGIAVAALLLLYFASQYIKNKNPLTSVFRLYRPDAGYLAVLYAFGLAIWLYGFFRACPAYDEVFSAVNCAGIHPFQTASYYMLPNNHVFFNVLNAITGAYTEDKVFSGRILSGLAFAALIPILYYWLRSKTASRPYAALFCALLMLQFPTWGFAFQGRGYSLYLLCSWASFIYLQRYIQMKSRPALLVHAIAVVIGYWTVPSFLFWHAALCIYLLINMLRWRRMDWPAIRAQAVAVAFVFLAFLPVFCFSGAAALMDNGYVKDTGDFFTNFVPNFRVAFRSAIQYCFSGFVDAHDWSYVALFFLPLALLPFIRKSRASGSVGFYVIVWVAFCIVELKIQHFPFMRNLIAHASITLAAALLACYAFIRRALWEGKRGFRSMLAFLLDLRADRDWGKWRIVQAAAIAGAGLVCIAVAVHFVRFNQDHIHDSLYFYNADSRYRTLHEAVMTLPAGARVGVSDEGFYWEYLCERRGLTASMCMGPSATHYIKMDTEILPPYLEGRVEKIRQADEYEIYRVR